MASTSVTGTFAPAGCFGLLGFTAMGICVRGTFAPAGCFGLSDTATFASNRASAMGTFAPDAGCSSAKDTSAFAGCFGPRLIDTSAFAGCFGPRRIDANTFAGCFGLRETDSCARQTACFLMVAI